MTFLRDHRDLIKLSNEYEMNLEQTALKDFPFSFVSEEETFIPLTIGSEILVVAQSLQLPFSDDEQEIKTEKLLEAGNQLIHGDYQPYELERKESRDYFFVDKKANKEIPLPFCFYIFFNAAGRKEQNEETLKEDLCLFLAKNFDRPDIIAKGYLSDINLTEDEYSPYAFIEFITGYLKPNKWEYFRPYLARLSAKLAELLKTFQDKRAEMEDFISQISETPLKDYLKDYELVLHTILKEDMPKNYIQLTNKVALWKAVSRLETTKIHAKQIEDLLNFLDRLSNNLKARAKDQESETISRIFNELNCERPRIRAYSRRSPNLPQVAPIAPVKDVKNKVYFPNDCAVMALRVTHPRLNLVYREEERKEAFKGNELWNKRAPLRRQYKKKIRELTARINELKNVQFPDDDEIDRLEAEKAEEETKLKDLNAGLEEWRRKYIVYEDNVYTSANNVETYLNDMNKLELTSKSRYSDELICVIESSLGYAVKSGYNPNNKAYAGLCEQIELQIFAKARRTRSNKGFFTNKEIYRIMVGEKAAAEYEKKGKKKILGYLKAEFFTYLEAIMERNITFTICPREGSKKGSQFKPFKGPEITGILENKTRQGYGYVLNDLIFETVCAADEHYFSASEEALAMLETPMQKNAYSALREQEAYSNSSTTKMTFDEYERRVPSLEVPRKTNKFDGARYARARTTATLSELSERGALTVFESSKEGFSYQTTDKAEEIKEKKIPQNSEAGPTGRKGKKAHSSD